MDDFFIKIMKIFGKSNQRKQFIFFQNYFIFKDKYMIYLYDENGNFLDELKIKQIGGINNEFGEICKISDNYLIFYVDSEFYKMTIINDRFSVKKILIFNENYYIGRIAFSKKNNILFVYLYNFFVKGTTLLLNINSLSCIQKIKNKKSNGFFIMNEDIFITYDDNYISFYKKINRTKKYEFYCNIKFKQCETLIKINNNTLIAKTVNNIFSINNKLLKISKIPIFFVDNSLIEFIYNIKGNIYLYKGSFLYIIKFLNNIYHLINLVAINEDKLIKHFYFKYSPGHVPVKNFIFKEIKKGIRNYESLFEIVLLFLLEVYKIEYSDFINFLIFEDDDNKKRFLTKYNQKYKKDIKKELFGKKNKLPNYRKELNDKIKNIIKKRNYIPKCKKNKNFNNNYR